MSLIFRCLDTNALVEAVAEYSIFLLKNGYGIESISQMLDSLVEHTAGYKLKHLKCANMGPRMCSKSKVKQS